MDPGRTQLLVPARARHFDQLERDRSCKMLRHSLTDPMAMCHVWADIAPAVRLLSPCIDAIAEYQSLDALMNEEDVLKEHA